MDHHADSFKGQITYMFYSDMDHQADSFQERITNMFYPRRILPTSFSINLTDLESVDLRVKPTQDYHAHLLIEGNAVNILTLTSSDFEKLGQFNVRRICKYLGLLILKFFRALGIASLGNEILSSLKALYADDEFFDKAETMGLFSPRDQTERVLGAMLLRNHVNTQPEVWYLNS